MFINRTTSGIASFAATSDWVLQDNFTGTSFFDNWWFWDKSDPTNGYVNFLSNDDAWSKGNIYIDGKSNNAVMQVNHWTNLPLGTNRDSIRIHSLKTYNSGLFILDVDHVPTGCSTWPAFWMNGPDPWPQNGEVDIMESVNDNDQNQMTLHTGEGCYLTNPGVFSGTALKDNCLSGTGSNAGCGIVSTTKHSVGSQMNSAGGGMYILKFDITGIQIWTFTRATIPPDAYTRTPNPNAWRMPDAAFSSAGCAPEKHFDKMTIIFDITLCGDWAGDGSAWASSRCSGTCRETVMTASNYDEAYFSIRSLKPFSSASWSNPPSYKLNSTVQPGSTGIKREHTHPMTIFLCSAILVLWVMLETQ